MSKSESDLKKAVAVADDDEPDEWDKRIFSTGCAGKSRCGELWIFGILTKMKPRIQR
ncbi:uncharacterized protein K444DRAFT_612724 [Hyaloscypha bicolor E]|uniref:Uncharacterized protein n=1 Tax=Hyaloscypha bicolor E TaxID=1095630 RepID=A0A2J6TAQ6_9HELO|nr:uncharacterized protein K444DRAFT_612724 [Hyaloscypha bicolor E]PMD60081.1 hypothetical protein K444DRAFT_612724 [Hyaloscypha bicolor E]